MCVSNRIGILAQVLLVISRNLHIVTLRLSVVAVVSTAALHAQGPDSDTTISHQRPVAVDTASFARSSDKRDTTADTSKSLRNEESVLGEGGISDPVDYTADYIALDVDSQILHLIGNAYITYRSMTLTADTITYRINSYLFTARGSPRLIEGNDTTVGRYLAYNAKTRRGKVHYASSHMDGAYFNAQEVVKSKDNTFYARQTDYTTCARVDSPHYYFYAKDVKVLPNDKAVARPAVLNVGDAPVAAVPYFIMPLDRSRSSGLLTPSFGGHPGRNAYLDNVGYYWAINDYVDAELSARIKQFRDYTLQVRSHYVKRYRLRGTVSARYAGSGDFLNRTNNWVLNYNHNHTLVPDKSLRISGRGTLMGEKDFYRRYSENTNEIMEKKADASLGINKKFTRINASASMNLDREQNLNTGKITQTVPGLNVNVPGRPLIPQQTTAPDDSVQPAWYNNVYYNWSARAKRKQAHRPNDPVEPEYTRSGASQNLRISYDQTVLRWFKFSPNVTLDMYAMDAYKDTAATDTIVTVDTLRDTLSAAKLYADTNVADVVFLDTLFADEIEREDTFFVLFDTLEYDTATAHPIHEKIATDYAWSAGARLSTTLYGIFPIRFLNFRGLRHVMSPSIRYSFTPKHKQDKKFYPIGISPPSARRRSQRISLSLGNTFDGKIVTSQEDGDAPQKETQFRIVTANASISYDFEAPVRKFSMLSLSGATSNRLANINYSTDFWMYDLQDRLSAPILSNASMTVNPRLSFSASGLLWGGDLRVLHGCTPHDPIRFRNAGAQKWSAGFSPAITIAMTRDAPGEPFIRTNRYQLGLSAQLNFTRDWRVRWNGNYDFEDNRLNSGALSFHFDLECWEMRFRWRPPAGINPGYYFIVQIKEIPEIKWEKRD